MSQYVKHRGSKRLTYRVGGRFARQPTLEQAGVVRVCERGPTGDGDWCGKLIVRDESGAWPETCPACGRPTTEPRP